MKQKVDCDGDKVVFNNTIKSLEYLARNNSITSQNALNLINRQKAEIERLNDSYEKLYLKYDDVINDNKFLKRKNNEQKAEIERLQEKYDRMKFNLESVLAERGIE